VLIPVDPRVGSLGAKSFPCSSRQHAKFMRSIRAVLGTATSRKAATTSTQPPGGGSGGCVMAAAGALMPVAVVAALLVADAPVEAAALAVEYG
jgi:hypothetical protein